MSIGKGGKKRVKEKKEEGMRRLEVEVEVDGERVRGYQNVN